ncbi:MAG TPA: SIMPL domain-containing protein [Candidatus Paceibacterota bacterium]|nr:SIMPL domain-containing protein [Candidatus Paceibacterota bacterium]
MENDNQTVRQIIEVTHWPRIMAAAALGMLAIFLLVATVNELRSYKFIGAGIQPTSTIDVSGTGKVTAVPDTATFTFTTQATAADVGTAQSKATQATNAIVSYLTGAGVSSKDIQTSDYEIYPQYSYQDAACPLNVSSGGTIPYCPPGKQTLTGYQISQTDTVKVEDLSKAGTLLAGVGSRGVSDVSGLTFTVSNQEDLQNQARDMAIADAQKNAQDLAKALGVSIVDVVSYSENNNTPGPLPIYAMATNGAGSSAPVAPQISTGQNTITSDVSVTYEISQ